MTVPRAIELIEEVEFDTKFNNYMQGLVVALATHQPGEIIKQNPLKPKFELPTSGPLAMPKKRKSTSNGQ